MALVLYKQSKAFVFLSRPNLIRLSISTGVCVAAYRGGKHIQHSSSDDKSKTYGRIMKRYGLICGAIHWGHVLVTCGGALVFAKIKNFPRALYLQRGFYYGERMGFATMLVYPITRELSGREWFAQIASSSYTGLNYGLLQNLKGWAAYHAFMKGFYAGIGITISYYILCWMNDIYQIFRDPNLKYSEWHNFDIEHYTYRRLASFFNAEEWTRYFENRNIRQTIVQCRQEMDELEEIMKKLNIQKEDLVHVKWDEVNDRMFEIIEKVKTGRPQFDNMQKTSATLPETMLRTLDPPYTTYGEELKDKNKDRIF